MNILQLYAVAASVAFIITATLLIGSIVSNIKEAAMYRRAFEITAEIKKTTSIAQVRALDKSLLDFYTTYLKYCEKKKVDFHYQWLVNQCMMKHRVLVAERDMYKGKVVERELETEYDAENNYDRQKQKIASLTQAYGATPATLSNLLNKKQNGKN
jgi:hypothetical protein